MYKRGRCGAAAWLAAACVAMTVLAAPIAHGAEVEVRQHNGRPMVFVDGKPRTMLGYCPDSWARYRFEPQMPWFYPHKMGLYLIIPPARKGDWRTSQYWVGDTITSQPQVTEPEVKMHGFSLMDEPVADILKHDPDAVFIVRFGLREPPSWRRLHPQEYFITDDGDAGHAPSLASELYWDMAAKYCAAIIQYCESRPWADRVIGYANFHRNEGTHQPPIWHYLFDHNPTMVARWRVFLKDKYNSVEKLREAHGDPSLTFNNVRVPKDKLRGATVEVAASLYWQHARDNQPLRDYLLLQRDLWHLRFRQMSKAMRTALGGKKKILVHDALKQTMIGWNLGAFAKIGNPELFAAPELMAGSGHMNVAELFDTPGFSGLITPHDYQARGIGGVFEPEGIVDSCVLRGKIFYCEADTRTYAGYQTKRRKRHWRRHWGVAMNDREFDAVSWRNVATALTRGFDMYYMDLLSEWFTAKPIQKTIGRQVQVIRESVDWPHQTMPGIAMILDDTSVLETNGSKEYLSEAIQWEWKMGLARCGVPHRIYLFDDLALDNFPEHRVFYFPNLFRVDETRLKLLREKVLRNGHVVVWGPGSGISDGQSIDSAHATRLTGFTFETRIVNYPRRTIVSNFEHPATRDLSADTVIGGRCSFGPILFPVDGTPWGLAWTKNGQRQTGLAVKEFGRGVKGTGEGDYAAVFTTSVPLPANLWRGLARFGGAHVYCETNDVLMASRRVVALHSLKSGPKRIALPEACDVTDIITGKPFAGKTREIRFDLDAPETRVFLLRPIGE